jgi:hypothetical protein
LQWQKRILLATFVFWALCCQVNNGNAEDGYGTVLYAERPRVVKKGWWGYGGVKIPQLSS